MTVTGQVMMVLCLRYKHHVNDHWRLYLGFIGEEDPDNQGNHQASDDDFEDDKARKQKLILY